MLAGPICSHVDQIWNPFWSDRVSNPLAVLEQLTSSLMFTKRLDDTCGVSRAVRTSVWFWWIRSGPVRQMVSIVNGLQLQRCPG